MFHLSLPRGRALAIVAAMVSSLALPAHAQAPAYPSKAITFIVPFAAGSATDSLARTPANPCWLTTGRVPAA